MLGIPTVVDRMIQQAIVQVLSPRLDQTFSDSSFGFRAGRSAHDALAQTQRYAAQGHKWVVDLDLEDFFNRINHDIVMARVARQVEDKRLLRLIRRFVEAGLMEGGVLSQRAEGAPQGGPLSPLLSNVLLDEVDKELEKRGHCFCRYADDVNIYVHSARAGERVLHSMERYLWNRLRLRVNRSKSKVERTWNSDFLGYRVTKGSPPRLVISPRSIKRFRIRLKDKFRRGRGMKLETAIIGINRYLRGWMSYYGRVRSASIYERLDQWIRRHLRCNVWRQWKAERTRLEKLQSLGVNRERAGKVAWDRAGPWKSSNTYSMRLAFPNAKFKQKGLISLKEMHRRLASSM